MPRTNANPIHLDNFTTPGDAFEIIDCSPFKAGEVTGRYLIATGRTLAEAIERFYSRYMLRGAIESTGEREIIERAQQRGNLVINEIRAGVSTLIERNPQLIAVL
jgi:hypothetical protein